MCDRDQGRALFGPLKDIQKLVLKPLLRCLGSVHMVIVLLEGEPHRALDRFSSRISLYFSPLIFASILTSLPLLAAEKHLHSMMLPPPCFTVGMVPGSSDLTLGIQAEEFNLGFIRPENLVSHGLRVIRCLLANSKQAVMCLLLRSGFCLATLP